MPEPGYVTQTDMMDRPSYWLRQANTDLRTGMDGSAAAAAYTDSFVGSMTAMLARYEGTGGSAGTSFQVGFLAATSTMPAAILGNLASLLLPMLQAALAGQTSRTGAS